MIIKYRPKHLDVPYEPYQEPEGTLSDERVEDLHQILRRRYDLELTPVEAREAGRRLIRLYRAILGPIPEDCDPRA